MSVIEHIKTSTFVHYELYNLADDVAELNDLADDQPDRLATMRERLIALHREVMDDSPNFSLEEHRGKARRAFPQSRR